MWQSKFPQLLWTKHTEDPGQPGGRETLLKYLTKRDKKEERLRKVGDLLVSRIAKPKKEKHKVNSGMGLIPLLSREER